MREKRQAFAIEKFQAINIDVPLQEVKLTLLPPECRLDLVLTSKEQNIERKKQ